MSRILLSSLKYSSLKLNYASLAVQNRHVLKSTLPCLNCALWRSNYSTAAAAVAQPYETAVDLQISKLDQTVKRLGRSTLKEIESTLNEIRAAGSISVTQSLMIIRSCGSLLVEEKPERRTKLVQKIWNMLKNMDVTLDISHYNALLRVYLENDYPFVPSDFLSEIEEKGLEPNRVTCQRLITRYCQMGDIEGATKILQYMREKNLPINESVFNALISGHSQIGDMESAEGILKVMKDGGIEPSTESYTCLMCGYIKNGKPEKVYELLSLCERMDMMFSSKDYFDIIYAFAMHGYENEVDRIVSKIKKSLSYNQDAMNFVFKLLTANKVDVGYKVLKSTLKVTRPDGSILPLGNYFIAYLIRNDMPIDQVIKYSLELMDEDLNPRALAIAVENALRYKKDEAALSLFRVIKGKNLMPIRNHFFWPLLINYSKKRDIEDLSEVLLIMLREFNMPPSPETIRDYIIPHMLKRGISVEKILLTMKTSGIPISHTASYIVCHLLESGKSKEAAKIASEHVTSYVPKMVRPLLVGCFLHTRDVDSFLFLLQDISVSAHKAYTSQAANSESDLSRVDHREFIGEIMENVVDKLIVNGHKDVVENLLQKFVKEEIGITEEKIKSIQRLAKDIASPETLASLDKLASEEFATPKIKPKPKKSWTQNLDDKALQKLYETAIWKGQQPDTNLKRMMFLAYAKNNKLEKMQQLKEDLKAENYEFGTGLQVHELNAYVHENKMDEAMQIYNSMCELPNFVLNPDKTLRLATMLVEHEKYDQAYELLKKRADVMGSDEIQEETGVLRTMVATTLLNKLAEKGQHEKLKEFFDLLTTSKYCRVTNLLYSPLIKIHMKKDDYETALKEFENCVQIYNLTPLKNELSRYFIEKEDATSLQKITDLSTQVHGEHNTLLDLIAVFSECGRIKQAKKILENPGLRIRSDRFETICRSYVTKGDIEGLKNLLEVFKDVNVIDHSSVYEKLLSLYDVKNDAENALSLWLEIQEEDMQPSDTFLTNLAKILRRNNMKVPFVVPEGKTRVSPVESKPLNTGKTAGRGISLNPTSTKLKYFIDSGNFEEAMNVFSANVTKIPKSEVSRLIDGLLQSDRYEDAKKCYKMYLETTNNLIYVVVFKNLLVKAARNGDVDFFVEMDRKLQQRLKAKTKFSNLQVTAYLRSGRIEEYLSTWENGLEKIKDSKQLISFLRLYPRGGILDLLDEKPEYFSRVKAFAEKCCEIDAENNLQNVLWCHYMRLKEYDEADKIWNNYLKKADTVIFNCILKKCQLDLDIELGMKLLSILKNKPNSERIGFPAVYSTLIKVHLLRGEVNEAKEILEDAFNYCTLEHLSIPTLTTLKSACLEKNIDFPYKIPERQIRNNQTGTISDSDSSSDSD